jgi:hypothetical protein
MMRDGWASSRTQLEGPDRLNRVRKLLNVR